MRPLESLRQVLSGIDGKDYMAYQSLKGHYTHDKFELYIDSIPKDPYAPPHTGVYRVRIDSSKMTFSEYLFKSRIRITAFCDFLARCFYKNSCTISRSGRGTGNSGLITIAKPGQEILARTSVVLKEEYLEARLFIGLPAKNRMINADIAQKMILKELPDIVHKSLFAEKINLDELEKHVLLAEDSEFLRDSLAEKELVAFIANGAILPRKSGINSAPLDEEPIIKFQSPSKLEVEFDLPNKGKVLGMGIPQGVSLIIGGGYHGKSTLLDTISLGIYNFIPGDGREYCVSLPETVKIRAESGRFVCGTDISAFINNIPFRESTESFNTENASGSTSQAASISEAIEVGAKVLVMDEDTCAANFMIRDHRMQSLVNREHEPITAFVDLIRPMSEKAGISSILVMGGSGDYFDVCDTAIQMKEYIPFDVSSATKSIAEQIKTGREAECGQNFRQPKSRIPSFVDINALNNYGHFRITSSDKSQLVYGNQVVNLNDVEQLIEKEQVKGIGRAIHYLSVTSDPSLNLTQTLKALIENLKAKGLDLLDERLTGDISEFRLFELAAAINRIRSLKIQ